MIHPHRHKCFFTNEKSGLSALDIRNLVFYTGEIDRWDSVWDTAGGAYLAHRVANFEEPFWARTVATDPLALWFCGGDITCGITDDEFEAMIDGLESDFFDMPPKSLPMQNADCWMQAAVY